MCVQVRNVETQREAETPAELCKMMGVCISELVPEKPGDALVEWQCLCQVDVKATAEKFNWGYAIHDHDSFDVRLTPPQPT